MKFKAITEQEWISSALGAALAVLCGLILWKTPLGDAWVNASYDYLFRFGERHVTNNVVVVLMDNEAYDHFHQTRGQPWDRALHAQLLKRFAEEGCALVVFDVFFDKLRDALKDNALAEAMRRNRVVLMAKQTSLSSPTPADAGPTLVGAQPLPPNEFFLNAARTNWGVAWFDPNDSIVRRHWPYPSPGPYPSLPWTVARVTGAELSEEPCERYLRYYGPHGGWTTLSYKYAFTQPTNFFRGKIVFIGKYPENTEPDNEDDEFRTPYTRWTGESTAGVQINTTAFVNLVNDDWLRRPAGWSEILVLLATGSLLGLAVARMRLLLGGIFAVAFALIISLGAISWSHFTNFWFPWLIVAGGQMPCAVVWAVVVQRLRVTQTAVELAKRMEAAKAQLASEAMPELPNAPDYELLHPPFGEGAYGKVWLARNRAGKWQALKAVYLANFEDDAGPYEREFNGITKYQPISNQHPGLLRVDFVSEKLPSGYFYYVMELGDPLELNWEQNPSTYKPRDLVSERRRTRGQKLPVRECIRIGLALADALDFLHRQGLTHRDIKPQNIIFVNGRPKLADMGLIAEIRPPEQKRTYVGTPGYMPPAPEMPGTVQADIYALGMMLFVLSTGRAPAFFPEISTTLAGSTSLPEFFALNDVILKACHPESDKRYASAGEMHLALESVLKTIDEAEAGTTTRAVPTR